MLEHFSPLDHLVGEILVNQVQVVWLFRPNISPFISRSKRDRGGKKGGKTYLELLHPRHIIALAVQIIGVKRPDGLQHALVLGVHEAPVRAGRVPGVKAMVADHGKGLVRQRRLRLGNVVQVLVVAPAQHDVIHAAAGSVDAVFAAVDGMARVRVGGKGVRVDDGAIEGTANGEGVANDIPLALRVEEEEQFAEVVDQACELEPAGLAVATDGLGRLEEVLDLGEGGVRVGFVDEGVEFFHGLPDGHLGAGLVLEVVAGLEVVGDRLLFVLLTVESLDAIAGLFVLPEFGLVLFGVELGTFENVLFHPGGGGACFDFHLGFEQIDLVD